MENNGRFYRRFVRIALIKTKMEKLKRHWIMKFLTENILGTLKSIRTYQIYTLSDTELQIQPKTFSGLVVFLVGNH